MIVVGLDTATPSTVAGVLTPDGLVERRDDPAPGTRPGHAERLLGLVEDALTAARVEWAQVDRIAVGVGPGGFTGLRIGLATARGLALAANTPLVAVGTLHALADAAAAHAAGRPLVAALDARRGEAFAAAWTTTAQGELGAALAEPAALAPERLAALAAGALTVGDGSVRFRAELEAAGATFAPPDSGLDLVSAASICRLGALGSPAAPSAILPDYRRQPDAKPRSSATRP